MTNVDNTPQAVAAKLRQAGLRATPARIEVLKILTTNAVPLDVQAILRRLHRTAPDQATIYRILTSFVKAELARPVTVRPSVVSFEATDRPHHHHLICEKCGYVEDVSNCCDAPKPTPKSFQAVTSHQLEFMGICTKCA